LVIVIVIIVETVESGAVEMMPQANYAISGENAEDISLVLRKF
jgi:hypothetical protein